MRESVSDHVKDGGHLGEDVEGNDPALTSFLFCRGYAVEVVQDFPFGRGRGSGRVRFYFPNNSFSRRDIESFYGHRARVDPLIFYEVMECFQALRSLSAKQRGRNLDTGGNHE
jgi:hypothetical protein